MVDGLDKQKVLIVDDAPENIQILKNLETLDRFSKLAIGSERRMISLKKEIDGLLKIVS